MTYCAGPKSENQNSVRLLKLTMLEDKRHFAVDHIRIWFALKEY